jgi:hypothetical protein
MEVFNALTAEDRRMLTAVEMLDSLVMGLAEIRRNLQSEFLIFLFCV